MSIGLGQMRMTPDEFWDCEPREFYFAMEGFFEHQMFLQRQEWERERWSTNLLWNIQVDPKNRISPIEMIRFEWERPSPDEMKPPITREELLKLKDFYDGHKSGSKNMG
jgi:hypothetical protein